MKKSFFIFFICLLSQGYSALYANETEEVVVTGTLLKDVESDSSPVEQITSDDLDDLNLNTTCHDCTSIIFRYM